MQLSPDLHLEFLGSCASAWADARGCRQIVERTVVLLVREQLLCGTGWVSQEEKDLGKHGRGYVQGTLFHPSPLPYYTRYLRAAKLRARGARTGRTGLLCLWLFHVPTPSRMRGIACPSIVSCC